jgi:GNAT superfamily N-acetyltransferase
MCRAIEERPVAEERGDISVRVTGAAEAGLWADTSTKAWTHDHPEFLDFFQETSAVFAAREQAVCFLGEFNGEPGAAASLSIHAGIALLNGAATLPQIRRRGLQAALLNERLRYAFDQGCDLAMMVAGAGSDSQRNAERKGFQVAYTRIKWRLGG